MAVSGDSFCKSAWNGFLLNLKHILQFAWANFLAKMFVLVGKIGLCVLNCVSLYMIMLYITDDIGEVSSPAGPIIIVGIFTYIAASIFLGIFDEAVMALMTCLAIDTDLHGAPKYGPPTFHDSLDAIANPK
jgi:choline transporter-like protein 2/4/5